MFPRNYHAATMFRAHDGAKVPGVWVITMETTIQYTPIDSRINPVERYLEAFSNAAASAIGSDQKLGAHSFLLASHAVCQLARHGVLHTAFLWRYHVFLEGDIALDKHLVPP